MNSFLPIILGMAICPQSPARLDDQVSSAQKLKVKLCQKTRGRPKVEIEVMFVANIDHKGKRVSHDVKVPNGNLYKSANVSGYWIRCADRLVFLENVELVSRTGNVVFSEGDVLIEKEYPYLEATIPFRLYADLAIDQETLRQPAPETGTMFVKMAHHEKHGSALFLAIVLGGFEIGPLWAKCPKNSAGFSETCSCQMSESINESVLSVQYDWSRENMHGGE